MKVRTLLEGCGAGILIMLPYTWPQLSPDHVILYHSLLPRHAVAWGELIDLVSVSVIAACLIAYLKKKDTGLRSAAWSFIAAKFISVVLYVLATSGIPLSVAAGAGPHLSPTMVSAAVLLAGLILYRFWPRAYKSTVEGMRFLLLLVGFSMFWMVPELLHLGLVRQPVESAGFERPVPAASHLTGANDSPEKGRRIVWVLFDELSYDQIFDHPYPGVALPAFHALESESVSFEALRPAGYFTARVVPSFFLGNTIENLKSDAQGWPEVMLSGQKGWRYFDSRQTIFADAQRDGWTTGVVGWFNPYCRLLAGSLNSCFWRPAVGQLGPFAPSDSVWQSAWMPIRSMLLRSERRDILYRQEHEDDLTVLMQRARKLIRNENIRFVFIHLPVPHPPGIYDRKTGQMRAGGTYIDNLVLADRSLAELISTLNMTSSAPETTLVVCSDHSWRTPMWRPASGWTKEETAASKGRFDTRPVLMIHFPGQLNKVSITQPFDEIRLHNILLQMLPGDLNSPAELTSWLHNSPAGQQNLSVASGSSEESRKNNPPQAGAALTR